MHPVSPSPPVIAVSFSLGHITMKPEERLVIPPEECAQQTVNVTRLQLNVPVKSKGKENKMKAKKSAAKPAVKPKPKKKKK